MKSFNDFINGRFSELFLEYRHRNKYDVVAMKIYGIIIRYIETNNIDHSDVDRDKFIISLDDSGNKFVLNNLPNEYNISIYIRVFKNETILSARGNYSCDKQSKNNRSIYVYITPNEAKILKCRKGLNSDVYEKLKLQIYETVDHELSHLSEYGKLFRKSIRNELNKTSERFDDKNVFVDKFVNEIMNSEEYESAGFIIENASDLMYKIFKQKINHIVSYVLIDSEISAKISGLKFLSVEKSTFFIEEIKNYLINSVSKDTNFTDYNKLVDNKFIKKFYKKLVLTILNYFIESALLKYPVIDKKFDKVQIFDSTYIYNKNSKKFE